ncbi:helix-turn-helix domain-containing protein [Cupriavidus basilensis]|nr:helix-turn-helix domain-containing protein [Cupriavidus basilensis]
MKLAAETLCTECPHFAMSATFDRSTDSRAGGHPGRQGIFRVTAAHDADEHASNLSRWNQTYDQLSPGSFTGEVRELWLPHAQVFIERTNRSLRQSCMAWPDAMWFGVPLPSVQAPATVGGMAIKPTAIAVRPGGTEFELRTPEDFGIFGIVVETAEFARYMEEVEHRDPASVLGQREVLSVQPWARARLCRALMEILSEAAGHHAARAGVTGIAADKVDSALFCGDLQERLLGSLVTLLMASSDSAQRPSVTHINRQRTVQRIRDYLLAHTADAITVPDLCRHFHLSRRALQYCFEDVAGMSPAAYLRALRLNGVRRDLKSGAAHSTVSDVAGAWGFHHLSQFAQDYRRMFGELPSAALRGPAGHGGPN